MADKYYFSPLTPGEPTSGMGIYEHATGCCVYYSDGGDFYFEMGTGKVALYMGKDRHLYWAATGKSFGQSVPLPPPMPEKRDSPNALLAAHLLAKSIR